MLDQEKVVGGLTETLLLPGGQLLALKLRTKDLKKKEPGSLQPSRRLER